MSKLTAATRMTRVRDLEHHCRCYVNAYVMELEGRKGGSNHTSPGELAAREWGVLCELMFGILVQEGMVERIEEDPTEEDDP